MLNNAGTLAFPAGYVCVTGFNLQTGVTMTLEVRTFGYAIYLDKRRRFEGT